MTLLTFSLLMTMPKSEIYRLSELGPVGMIPITWGVVSLLAVASFWPGLIAAPFFVVSIGGPWGAAAIMIVFLSLLVFAYCKLFAERFQLA